MSCHSKYCDYYDPWDHPKMGGYNDEYWGEPGEPGEPISEEEHKKMLEEYSNKAQSLTIVGSNNTIVQINDTRQFFPNNINITF